MAISPQQLTIYLYSAHRAVIAIAQLSCFDMTLQKNVKSRVFRILKKNVKNVFSNYGYRYTLFVSLWFCKKWLI